MGRCGHLFAVAVVHGQRVLPVDLQVLPQRGWVGVRLVASSNSARVRLVRGVHVHVLLSVARVGKPAVTTLDLALKRFFAWK